MKKVFVLVIFSLFLFLIAQPALGEVSPASGQPLPAFSIPSPKMDTEKQYLGIGDSETFSPEQVAADVVIIEVFSMYCPHCQKEAPLVNMLYDRIASNESIRNKIKMLGIGIGNSSFEVGFFKKTYNIAFPLFPDADFSVHKVLGRVRTPFFIVAARGEGEKLTVIHTQLGTIGDPEKFLEKIIDLSNIE